MLIEKRIEVGFVNKLKIIRETDNGLYLEDLQNEEVLLPNAYVTADMEFGNLIDVFVYRDSEDRLVATTLMPKAFRDQFIYAKVIDITPFGAFVDIGLPKDLLVPKYKQKRAFQVGQSRIIKIVLDEETDRLIGVEKFEKLLLKDSKKFKQNEKVSIFVGYKTDLGYKVIVNNNYEGLIYANEVFGTLKLGEIKEAYIKNVREDGKLDIILQPINVKKSGINEEKILRLLKLHNNFMPYNYKSDATDIANIFAMSKKNFKRALTNLLEESKIILDEKGIKTKIN